MRQVRVVSRKSQLAMQQTRWVIDTLQRQCEGWTFEIVPVVTQGDRRLDVPLSEIGGKGLFVTEVEDALARGDGDLTVHSLKDVPACLASGLTLAGFPERVEARDALVSRHEETFMALRQGARVGTSSLRRAAQLRAVRPDIEIVSIRGNIDTRLNKLASDNLDAIVLAAAGLVRMNWTDRISELLPMEICLPAVGQGILGLECREDDNELVSVLQRITDGATHQAATAERALLKALSGGCQVPIAGYAMAHSEGGLVLQGRVASPDGTTLLEAGFTGQDAVMLGQKVADALLQQGAAELIASVGEV